MAQICIRQSSFSTIDSIFMGKNFMGCSKMWISAIGYYDWPFWSFNGPHIYSMGPCEGDLLLTPCLCLLCSVAFLGMWAWQSGAVWESLLGAPVLWERHIKTQRALCFRYLKKRSRKTMALRWESWKSVFVSEGWKTAHLEWSAY